MAGTIRKPYLPGHDIDSPGGQLRFDVASGAVSASGIAVTGIKPEDQVVLLVDDQFTDRQANFLSTADGKVMLDVDTDGRKLLVGWMDVIP
jgi:hypothetical protein